MTLMSNVEKSPWSFKYKKKYNIKLPSPTRKFYIFLKKLFTCFCYLRGISLFNNQRQLFLMSLMCVFRVLHMGISIMQWHIAVGVHTFRNAPFLRRKLVFGSYYFYPAFFIRLIFSISDVCRYLYKYT